MFLSPSVTDALLRERGNSGLSRPNLVGIALAVHAGCILTATRPELWTENTQMLRCRPST